MGWGPCGAYTFSWILRDETDVGSERLCVLAALPMIDMDALARHWLRLDGYPSCAATAPLRFCLLRNRVRLRATFEARNELDANTAQHVRASRTCLPPTTDLLHRRACQRVQTVGMRRREAQAPHSPAHSRLVVIVRHHTHAFATHTTAAWRSRTHLSNVCTRASRMSLPMRLFFFRRRDAIGSYQGGLTDRAAHGLCECDTNGANPSPRYEFLDYGVHTQIVRMARTNCLTACETQVPARRWARQRVCTRGRHTVQPRV